MNASVLVAGIGNIFHRDDAFGVVVAQKLARSTLPENIRVVDFGIRGIDLVFALLDGYDTTILVDAVARGGAPGTLYLIEPELDHLLDAEDSNGSMDGHSLEPLQVLRTAKKMARQKKSWADSGSGSFPSEWWSANSRTRNVRKP